MSFHFNLPNVLFRSSVYKLNDGILAKVRLMKDLGVGFDSKLLFNTHIDTLIAKAESMLGFLSAQEFHDPYTLKCLYTSFVRSQLYGRPTKCKKVRLMY